MLHARNTSPRWILLWTLGEHRGSEALCTRAGLHIASCFTHLENSEEAKRVTQAAPLRIELHSTHSGIRGNGAFYTTAAPRHTAEHSNRQANIKEAKRIARKLHRSHCNIPEMQGEHRGSEATPLHIALCSRNTRSAWGKRSAKHASTARRIAFYVKHR